MVGGVGKRGSLEGPPPSMQPHLGSKRPARAPEPARTPAPQSVPERASSSPAMSPEPSPQPVPSRELPAGGSLPTGALALNQPAVVSILYLLSLVTFGLTGIIGAVLAFKWKDEPRAGWEVSHYQYLVNTFWIALAGTFASFIFAPVVIGVLLMPALAILLIMRNIQSLTHAQKQQPMPNPGTWLV